MEKFKYRPIIISDVPKQTVFVDPNFDPKAVAKDPLGRVFALNDAAIIFATEQLAHGVPIEDVQRNVHEIHDSTKGRRRIERTLVMAKELFNTGISES